MRTMALTVPGSPLVLQALPSPEPGPDQVLIQVRACGVCRTDLHIAEGELAEPKLPLILGHEIVGTVVGRGSNVERFSLGERVGVPWLGHTCGVCRYCERGAENLCDRARFTGYQIDGGYAEYTIADQRFCFPLAGTYGDAEAAPLLCAGLIGYRSLRLTGEAEHLGIYGFGAAAHIITQVACHQGRKVFAFTRRGDLKAQAFARELGAVWVGDSDVPAPEPLDAAIIFAPVGSLVLLALRSVAKGAAVVCAGIHMSDIPAFPYHILWGERIIRSVANLTRRDGEEFLALAPQIPIHTQVETFTLEQANAALRCLKHGQVQGAAVLVINDAVLH